MGSFLKLDEFDATPVAISFSVDSYAGPMWHVRHLRNRSGWLMVCEVRLDTVIDSFTKTILACVSEKGEPIGNWSASKLLEMRCSLPKEVFEWPPDEIDDVADALYWDFLGSCDLEQLLWLETEHQRLDEQTSELATRVETVLSNADKHISTLRKRRRSLQNNIADRLSIDAEIATLESKMEQLAIALQGKVRGWREEADLLESDVSAALSNEGELEVISLVHWTTTSLRKGKSVRFPLQQEELFSAGMTEKSIVESRNIAQEQWLREQERIYFENEREEQKRLAKLEKRRLKQASKISNAATANDKSAKTEGRAFSDKLDELPKNSPALKKLSNHSSDKAENHPPSRQSVPSVDLSILGHASDQETERVQRNGDRQKATRDSGLVDEDAPEADQ